MHKAYLFNFLEKSSLVNYDVIKHNVHKIVKKMPISKKQQSSSFSFLECDTSPKIFVDDIYKLRIYTRISKCMMMCKYMKTDSYNESYRAKINMEIQKIVEDIEFIVKKYVQRCEKYPSLNRQSTIQNCDLDFYYRLKKIKQYLPYLLYNKLKKLVLLFMDNTSYSLN